MTDVKIVDLRPQMVRRFTRSDKRPSSPSVLGRFAGWISDFIINRKIASRPEVTGTPLLVSVGNLALGGTGKTPVVMSLARELASSGLKGAVLTRGYGSPLSGPLIIERENSLAGDEARMMAGHLEDTGWPVVQSRHRPDGLKFLKSMDKDLKIILLEDAFQTGGLARHIDLVILDSWHVVDSSEKPALMPVTGPVFPFGPWRETAGGAERADALLVETEGGIPQTSTTEQPVFSFRRFVKLNLVHGPERELTDLNLALLSGIARPEKFEDAVLKLMPKKAVLGLRCQDHVKYTNRLVDEILKEMDGTEAEILVTTAKDWVKLSNVWSDPRPVFVLEMSLIWQQKNALNQWLVERVNQLDSDQPGSTIP